MLGARNLTGKTAWDKSRALTSSGGQGWSAASVTAYHGRWCAVWSETDGRLYESRTLLSTTGRHPITRGDSDDLPAVATDGKRVVLVWARGQRLRFSQSTGRTWSANQPVSSQLVSSLSSPTVALVDGHTYAVWSGSAVTSTFEADNASGKFKTVNLTSHMPTERGGLPHLAVWKSTVWVARGQGPQTVAQRTAGSWTYSNLNTHRRLIDIAARDGRAQVLSFNEAVNGAVVLRWEN